MWIAIDDLREVDLLLFSLCSVSLVLLLKHREEEEVLQQDLEC